MLDSLITSPKVSPGEIPQQLLQFSAGELNAISMVSAFPSIA